MSKTLNHIHGFEIRDEHEIDAQLPYAVYNHDQYTPYPDQQKINYPVLIARFNNPVAATEWVMYTSGESEDEDEIPDDIDDSMDGDHQSALASAGWGTDEDYGGYDDYGDY